MRFCRRLVSLSSSARILSDSRTCRTSSQAEPSTWAPFQIMAESTTTTAEFNAAIDRMRQRIGTARSSPTMRKRPHAARPGGRSAVSSWRGVPKTNSLHLANAFDQCRGGRIVLRFCIDSSHRDFERLAVEVGDDRDPRRLRPPPRLLLEILPLLVHEMTGP